MKATARVEIKQRITTARGLHRKVAELAPKGKYVRNRYVMPTKALQTLMDQLVAQRDAVKDIVAKCKCGKTYSYSPVLGDIMHGCGRSRCTLRAMQESL